MFLHCSVESVSGSSPPLAMQADHKIRPVVVRGQDDLVDERTERVHGGDHRIPAAQ